MSRRSRTGGKSPKQGRKRSAPKHRNAPKATRNRGVSTAGQETVVARLTRERDEALLRETANAEILGLISRSPDNLDLVFRSILENATRICNARFGVLHLVEGGCLQLRPTAHYNTPPAFLELSSHVRPGPQTAFARAAATKQSVHIADIAAEQLYAERDPLRVAGVEVLGIRTLVVVPMLKGSELIGAIAIFRQEVRPFTDKQIELVQNFAAQAVIAIENARLLNELRQRTTDLGKALEQQTATSEVLGVISSSPGELQPVFEAMLQNAVRICDAQFGNLALFENDGFRFVAQYGAPPKYRDARQREPFIRGRHLDRVIKTKQVDHVADIAAEAPDSGIATLGGARTLVTVPMLKDDVLVGAISIFRQEVRPFTEKQIALVTNFAAQAVIAIENTRLLNELRQRTTDLSASLEQQTATSEVLRVISSSQGELQPVFEAMLANAVRLCEAKFGVLYRYDGHLFHPEALIGAPQPLIEFHQRRGAFETVPGTPLHRLWQTKEVVHTVDDAGSPSSSVRFGGARSHLAVPMFKGDALVGSIIIYRQEVRPFTDKQVDLVKNFAAQAVIAIENARLLNELRQRTTDLGEALEQQTATADVLRVISSSPGDLEPVFQAMLENAVRICEAKSGNLFGFDGKAFYMRADLGTPPAFAEFARQPRIWGRGTVLGQITRSKQAVHIIDLQADDTKADQDPGRIMAVNVTGARTVLGVPMLRENELIGAFVIFRQEVRAFTDKQIALVQNFAAQAVIAIENARLLNELRQRTTDLSESLEQQTATSEVLRVISSSPGELEPVFQAMLENATRICDAKFGMLFRLEDGAMLPVSSLGVPEPLMEFFKHGPHRPSEHAPIMRVARTKQPVHVLDFATERAYLEGSPVAVAGVELGGVRTNLVVPLLKENELIGAFAIFRQEVRPFSDKQIELARNFAAQAVIAIENTRLLNELRQRTTDLGEALDQQTATSEVLKVISSSPGDLEPVFQAMLENAVRICKAKFGTLFRYAGDACTVVAMHNVPESYRQVRRREPTFRYSPSHPLARVAATKQMLQIADLQADASYAESDPSSYRAMAGLAGARTILTVPMLKDDEPVGAIAIFRQEVRPFADKQIALMQNFAAQAVIAIENARLLNELRDRTAELEARSQEIATLNQQLEQRVADQVGEIERMGRLRRFLPPQVADLIVASGTEKQLESHRREITALFCDLRGFTGFSESSDPEDVMALLRDYHAAIGEIIVKYSGTLERFAGDGVMVIFNDPVPVENPALQAVLMALDMRAAIGAMIEKWRLLGHDLGFGIGIAHGFATLGTIGFEGRYDYAAIGTVSNVASRLCDEAKPGQILISPRVMLAVDKAVTVEPVGEFSLKGIRRPMAAYNVLAPSTSN